MKTRFLFTVIAAVSGLAACTSAQQQVTGAPVPDRTFGTWQVVTTAKDRNNGLCYAFAAPVSSNGNYTGKRPVPYVMATRRTSGKIEVSVSSGYPYKYASVVELTTDKKSFQLKAKDSVAWAQNDAQDKQLLAAIKKSPTVEVRGVTTGGETTTDFYSTTGFVGALARVKALCP